MRKQNRDLTHISPALETYTVLLLAFLSAGPIPLHVKKLQVRLSKDIFLFSTPCIKLLPLGRLVRLWTIFYNMVLNAFSIFLNETRLSNFWW